MVEFNRDPMPTPPDEFRDDGLQREYEGIIKRSPSLSPIVILNRPSSVKWDDFLLVNNVFLTLVLLEQYIYVIKYISNQI